MRFLSCGMAILPCHMTRENAQKYAVTGIRLIKFQSLHIFVQLKKHTALQIQWINQNYPILLFFWVLPTLLAIELCVQCRRKIMMCLLNKYFCSCWILSFLPPLVRASKTEAPESDNGLLKTWNRIYVNSCRYLIDDGCNGGGNTLFHQLVELETWEMHFVAFRFSLASLPLNSCWCADFSALHYMSSCTSCTGTRLV